MKAAYTGCISFLLLLFLTSSNNHCAPKQDGTAEAIEKRFVSNIELSPDFKKYWFQGNAELNIYTVDQERYGEIRKAQQVAIFVTEDFSRSKQVKLDQPKQSGTDRLPIMKLNTIRRFHTGIYDYSLMQSVFSPLSGAPTVKTTATVQDWCGQVFAQLNHTGGHYQARTFSYFESEGDRLVELPPSATLESEFWTRLRLGPNYIRQGTYDIIPPALFSRLRHKPLGSFKAEVRLKTDPEKPSTAELLIEYKQLPRRLSIQYETAFPYRIIGWEEQYQETLLSRGQLEQTSKSAYWARHNKTDAILRDSLNLDF